jgi:hypothetical protein
VGEHLREIGGAVGARLVGAEVEPDDPAGRPRGEPAGDRLHAVVVEAEAVDRGAIGAQAEQARAGIAGLRARGRGADLDEAEARAQERCHRLGVLVEARGEAERVRQVEPARCCASRGEVIGPRRGPSPARSPAPQGHGPSRDRACASAAERGDRRGSRQVVGGQDRPIGPSASGRAQAMSARSRRR